MQITMPGMKRDCGGAAGILGAFRAAVLLVRKLNQRLLMTSDNDIHRYNIMCNSV